MLTRKILVKRTSMLALEICSEMSLLPVSAW
jgi:hypothetical protein